VKIAYLINTYPQPSTTFIRREMRALEELGFEVTRIALRRWNGKLVEAEDELEGQRTRYVLNDGASPLLLAVIRTLVSRPWRLARAWVLAWRMGRKADRPLLVHLVYLAEACRIEPWLRALEIRHVHAHFGTNSATVAMLVHALGGPSWSFTTHGPEEFDRAQLIGLAEKIHRSAFVVAVSSYGRSQLYRLTEQECWSKIKVVHCGLDRSYFDPRANLLPSARRLVCVGRLCPQKGQLLLVEAAARLAEEKTDFELVLAGDGELRSEIESLIAHYKCRASIRLTGWIDNTQVREEILGARALVLPSFAEGLPVALLEAMALGRPVISTYVAGIPELVCAGENGWLVPAGNVEALVEAMRICLDSPTELLLHMGEAARKRVLSQHDVAKEAEKLGKLFRRTVEASGQPACMVST
jgi:colanic acid/amylovoran biosynthesis glycosyltransferase